MTPNGEKPMAWARDKTGHRCGWAGTPTAPTTTTLRTARLGRRGGSGLYGGFVQGAVHRDGHGAYEWDTGR